MESILDPVAVARSRHPRAVGATGEATLNFLNFAGSAATTRPYGNRRPGILNRADGE